MTIHNAKLVSKQYSLEANLSSERGREYFLVQPTTADITLTLGGGNGSLVIPLGSYYEPYIPPTTSIDIVSTGDFVVVTNV